MTLKLREAVALLALALVAGSSATTEAGVLFGGKTVGYEYLYPEQTDIFHQTSFAVGSGTELSDLYPGSPASLDVSDTNISVDYDKFSGFWDGAAFNGFHVWDVNGTIGDITSVTINPATNMIGFDSTRITFDANNIYVNWRGLSFDLDTIVSLDVNGATTVTPEPTSLALLATGGIGLVGGAIRRRRARKTGAV